MTCNGREVVFLWKDVAEVPHTLHVAARKGSEQARGPRGFLSLIHVDGKAQRIPSKVRSGRIANAASHSSTHKTVQHSTVQDAE